MGALALGALLIGALALGAVLIVAYLDRMEPTGAAWHFPVVSSRSPVLPDPPAAFVRVDPLTDAPTFMSGSPDHLVLSKGYGRSGIGTKGSDSAAVPVVAFDFARWRWMSLPNARYDSLALPDGLAGVGLSCGPAEDGNARCQVEVSTLRWGDRHWRNQQVTTHAEWVHEGGSVEPLGVRGAWAYFKVSRESSHRVVVRVGADGEVRMLPPLPQEVVQESGPVTEQVPVTCVTARGLDTVRSHVAYGAAPVNITFGPVLRLDDRQDHPRWRTLPGTAPLAAPGAGAERAFVCGPDGLVLLHATGTSAWIGNRFVTVSSAPTPPFPHGGLANLTALPFPVGGLVSSDHRDLHPLRKGVWEPAIAQAAKQPWTIVGELVAYQVVNPTTGITELHVSP